MVLTNPLTGQRVAFTAAQLDAIAAAFYAIASDLAAEHDAERGDIAAGFCVPVSVAAVAVDVYQALGLSVPPLFTAALDDCPPF